MITKCLRTFRWTFRSQNLLTDKKLIFLLMIGACVIWLPRYDSMIDLRWDGGVYYTLGESLAQVKGYRILYEPGEILAVQYPPGLPFIVACTRLATGMGSLWATCRLLLALYFLMFCGYLLGVYYLTRTFCSPLYAFLAGCVCLFHTHTFYLSNLCFAELPFMLLSTLFFLCLRRGDKLYGGVACGVLAAACYFLRTAGIVFLGVWIIDALIRKRLPATLARGGVALLIFLSWFLYVAWIESGESFQSPKYEYQRADYMYYNVSYRHNSSLIDPFQPERGKSGLTGLLLRVFNNTIAMTGDIGQTVTTDMNLKESPRWIGWMSAVGLNWLIGLNIERPLHVVLTILVVAGLITLILKGEYTIPLYTFGTFALVCLTPWPGQFKRYLTPVTPFCVLAFFTMIEWWRNGQLPAIFPTSKRFPLVVLVLFLLFSLPPDLFSFYKLFSKYSVDMSTSFAGGKSHTSSFLYLREPWLQFDKAVEWIGNHAAEDDVVASSAPYWVYLRTGRKAVMPPFDPNPVEADRLMADVPVKYLIVDAMEFVDLSRRYGTPVVTRFPERWRLVCRWESEFGPTIIYERQKSDEQSPSPKKCPEEKKQ